MVDWRCNSLECCKSHRDPLAGSDPAIGNLCRCFVTVALFESGYSLGEKLPGLGATATLVARPIPDAAFKALTDDDKAVASAWRKLNSAESKLFQAGHDQLAIGSPVEQFVADLARGSRKVEEMADDTVAQIEEKRRAFESLSRSSEMTRARLMADAWCAAFLAPKRPGIPRVTSVIVRTFAEGVAEPEVLEVIDETRRQ